LTDRERMIALLEGRAPDRVPWIPRLEIWYRARTNDGRFPAGLESLSLRQITKKMGMGFAAREGVVFRKVVEHVKCNEIRRGNDLLTEYITPVGTITTTKRTSPELQFKGIGFYAVTTEFPIKKPQDYEVMNYIVENTHYEPTYEDFLRYDADVGDDCLPMIPLGLCPMHRIMMDYIGYNNAFIELHDNLDLVEHLWETMRKKEREAFEVARKSPGRLFLYGEHFDSVMTFRPLFEKYFLPSFRELARILHKEGKYMACHGDADASDLLDLIAESGFDMCECFVCHPMVKCPFEDAYEAWKGRITIWGGIPSNILTDATREEGFRKYVDNLLDMTMQEKRIILGVGDVVMPEAIWSRLEYISEAVSA